MSMYYNYNPATDIGVGILIFFIAIGFLLFMGNFIPRRTQRYRRELVDLYVAGRIRQLAEQHKVNLSIEYEAFKKWRKLRNREDKSLDYVMEEELIEEIDEDKTLNKTINKTEEKKK